MHNPVHNLGGQGAIWGHRAPPKSAEFLLPDATGGRRESNEKWMRLVLIRSHTRKPDKTRVPQDYAQIMHTPRNIMHGDYARIMHRRAIDYARVLKDYAEAFAILYRLPLRATRLCTDYARAIKYYARRLCTDYAQARHRLCTGTKRLCRSICNSVRIRLRAPS